ncbi:MAG: hypothetical protein ABIH20_06915 [Candidatus Diapherotrites archaeon]
MKIKKRKSFPRRAGERQESRTRIIAEAYKIPKVPLWDWSRGEIIEAEKAKERFEGELEKARKIMKYPQNHTDAEIEEARRTLKMLETVRKKLKR